MHDDELIALLKQSYRGDPSAVWLSRTRARVCARAAQSRRAPAAQPRSVPGFWETAHALFARRTVLAPVGVFALLALFAGTTILSAHRVLPSSPLYPVRLATESVRGSLAFTAEQRAEYAITVATERVADMTAMAKTRPSAPVRPPATNQDAMAKAAKRYAEAVTDSARTVQELKEEGKEDLARTQAERLEEVIQAYAALYPDLNGSTTTPAAIVDARIAGESAHAAASALLAPPAPPASSDALAEGEGDGATTTPIVADTEELGEGVADVTATTTAASATAVEPLATPRPIVPNIVD